MMAADSTERTEWWHQLHSTAFPLALSIEKEHDLQKQLAGIDRNIELPWGTATIEEKLDATQFTSTLAFETVSNMQYNNPGWAEKHQASKIFCYAHEQNGMASYFSTSALFAVWQDRKAEWIAKYREREVRYSNSKVVPVPLSAIYEALPKHYKVFQTAPLVIPSTIDLSARFQLFKHGATA